MICTPIKDTRDLLGYWPLSQEYYAGGQYLDCSSTKNHGLPYNTPIAGTDFRGRANRALVFNGSTQYIAPSTLVSNAVRNISVSIWFQTANYQDSRQVLLCNGNANAASGFGIIINNDSGTNGRLYILKNMIEWVDTSHSITNSNWHHLVFTVSNLTNPLFVVYIDNGVVYSSIHSSKWGTPSGTTQIGRDDQPNSTPYFNGSLSEVRFYNRCLTKSEVNALYLLS